MAVRVALSAASSLDGKIASAAREPVAFTSRADRARLFDLRDRADAILIGAGTLRAEDYPLLPDDARAAARVAAGRRPAPVRAVVSRSLALPLARALARRDGAPLLVFGPRGADPARRAELEAWGCEVVLAGEGEADLALALAHLERAHGVRDVLCEGGGELNAALFAADLVDDVHLTLCPVVLGGRSAPTPVDGPGFPQAALRRARLSGCQVVGEEVFLSYAVARPARPEAPGAPGGAE